VAETVVIPRGSRYKDTAVFRSTVGLEYGTYTVPREFRRADGFSTYRVTQGDVGMLDRVAVAFYGQGMEPMWWVIALANAMIDPELEMRAGQVLVIPPVEVASAYISRGAEPDG